MGADFALAYAVSKAVRAPRLALDAAAAAALASRAPQLKAVRVSLLIDAAGRLARVFTFWKRSGGSERGGNNGDGDGDGG